jgi:hypothetical protein
MATPTQSSLCRLFGSTAIPFRIATDVEAISGKFAGDVPFSPGKFAVIEKRHDFTFVP